MLINRPTIPHPTALRPACKHCGGLTTALPPLWIRPAFCDCYCPWLYRLGSALSRAFLIKLVWPCTSDRMASSTRGQLLECRTSVC